MANAFPIYGFRFKTVAYLSSSIMLSERTTSHKQHSLLQYSKFLNIAMDAQLIPYIKMLSFLKERPSEDSGSVLSNIKLNDLLRHLHQLMEARRPFLSSNYSLMNLAHDLGIEPYQLSAFINKILGQRYNDLINYYRITYCLNLLQSNPHAYTKVHELAALCGYSNRNTFISAFKKHTKLTPSAYIKKLRKVE